MQDYTVIVLGKPVIGPHEPSYQVENIQLTKTVVIGLLIPNKPPTALSPYRVTELQIYTTAELADLQKNTLVGW